MGSTGFSSNWWWSLNTTGNPTGNRQRLWDQWRPVWHQEIQYGGHLRWPCRRLWQQGRQERGDESGLKSGAEREHLLQSNQKWIREDNQTLGMSFILLVFDLNMFYDDSTQRDALHQVRFASAVTDNNIIRFSFLFSSARPDLSIWSCFRREGKDTFTGPPR